MGLLQKDHRKFQSIVSQLLACITEEKKKSPNIPETYGGNVNWCSSLQIALEWRKCLQRI